MTVRKNPLLKLLAASSLILSGLGVLGTGQVASADTFPPVVPAPAKVIDSTSVGMQMFMWNWNALKDECTNVLGPSGIDWILVMPPQEHVTGDAWWVHYQPVSYKLESSLGTELQFRQMVNACNTAGVKVIADAVINHMANGGGTGWAGQEYTKYNYPGVYSDSNFHDCRNNILNYNYAPDYQFCQLGGLPDLATEQPAVRDKITAYLQSLADIGVSGFRIDAAKHIAQADLDAIKAQLNRPSLYWVLEVAGGGQVAEDYSTTGDVWAWNSISQFDSAFYTPGRAERLGNLARYFAYPDSAVSVQMVNNHDTERGSDSLSYKNGKMYELAFIELLGEAFGKPMLYSGYAFFGDSASPNTSYNGYLQDPSCSRAKGASTYKNLEFICEQRWTSVKGMTAFHHTVGVAPVTNMFNKTKGVLGYGRGTLGYLLINSNKKTYKATVKTSMPKGTYCDLVTGGKNPIRVAKKSCVGKTIIVNSKGQIANYSLAATSAFAISADSKLK